MMQAFGLFYDLQAFDLQRCVRLSVRA